METEFTSSPSLQWVKGNSNSVCQTHFANNIRQPTIESRKFSAIVSEIGGLLKFRPIAYISSDINDEEALTPIIFYKKPLQPFSNAEINKPNIH